MELTPIYIITFFLIIVAAGIIMLVLVYQKKQLQYLGEKEQLKVRFEKEILESKLEIQEQTLKNISQEIHDNIGQVLSLIKLTLNTVDYNKSEALKEAIDASKQLLGKAIQDMRDLAKILNSDNITQIGLIKAIEYEFYLIKKTGDYQTKLIEEGDSFRLSPHHELILFRIFQEAVNNILKHAHATLIAVHSCYTDAHFSLEISDNGLGFNPDELADGREAGLGIRNIKNRAQIIGADFAILSESGKSTALRIDLPLNRSSDPEKK